MFIDIHTHHLSTPENTIAFIIGKHTLGIHPWELKRTINENIFKDQFLKLKMQFRPEILAIGECGLDRRREGLVDIKFQEIVLSWHMDLAAEIERPLIIHCVRAYSDLLKLLKQKEFEQKILLHDFSGNFEEARALLHYDCYFSFGARLFRSDQKSANVLTALPKERIFLETDDQNQYSIKEIYQKAQTILHLDAAEMQNLFYINLKRFLNLDNVSSSDVINNLC